MTRKHYIIVVIVVIIVAFSCMVTGYSMGDGESSDCPKSEDCPNCPECPEMGESEDCPNCPECPGCPECPECETVTEEIEIEVTRIVKVEVEVEKIVTATPQIPLVQFNSPGMLLVGTDVEPGTYKIEGDCYWERLSCLDGSFDCIIANAKIEGQSYVEILISDKAFNTNRSCSFTKTE